MRKLSTPASSFFRWKSFVVNSHRLIAQAPPTAALQQFLPARHLAQVRTDPLSELWFTPSSPRKSPADDLLGSQGNGCDHKPPDERTLRLGKSEQYSLVAIPIRAVLSPYHSITHALAFTAEHSNYAHTTRDPLSFCLATPVPIHPSTSTGS